MKHALRVPAALALLATLATPVVAQEPIDPVACEYFEDYFVAIEVLGSVSQDADGWWFGPMGCVQLDDYLRDAAAQNAPAPTESEAPVMPDTAVAP